MKRLKSLLWTVAVFAGLFFFSSPLQAQTAEYNLFKVKVGFMVTDFHSSLQYDESNVQGTKINLKSDLDLENNQIVPMIEAWIGGTFALNLGYFDSKYEGEARSNSQITVDGQVFAGPGQEVTSKIDFRTFDFAAYGNFLGLDKLRLAAIAGGKYFYYKSRLENESSGDTNNQDIETLLPYLGGEVEFSPLDFVSLSLRVRGSSYQWSEADIDRGNYLDVELGVALNLNKYISIMMEYRYFEVRITREDNGEFNRYTNTFDAVQFSVIGSF